MTMFESGIVLAGVVLALPKAVLATIQISRMIQETRKYAADQKASRVMRRVRIGVELVAVAASVVALAGLGVLTAHPEAWPLPDPQSRVGLMGFLVAIAVGLRRPDRHAFAG